MGYERRILNSKEECTLQVSEIIGILEPTMVCVSNSECNVTINLILYRKGALQVMQSSRLACGWNGEISFS
jgi:hypothetical protein